jgi:nucleotide-binding universal stress UspA family protein
VSTVIDEVRDVLTLSAQPRMVIPRILVASNGEAGSDGALATAARLLESARARITVVGVVEHGKSTSGRSGAVPWTDSDLASARCELTERLLVQLARISPRFVDWRVEVREGDPATVLSSFALGPDVRLIIAGLGHHDSAEHRFGAETALRTLRLSCRPVLAVPESFDRLPHRAIVATDFSDNSLHAAREGLSLFPSLRQVDFVHVAPTTDLDIAAIHRWMAPSGMDPASKLEDVRRRIGVHAGITFRTTALTGESSLEILRFAKSSGADLIVAGSRGAGLAQRIIVGSTASRLLRDAPCALLAVPAAMKRPWSRLPNSAKQYFHS